MTVEATRSAYAAAGVDVAAGDRAVELLRRRIGLGGAVDLLGALGGFAAAVRVPAGLRDAVLLASTDGVGTKTDIARKLGRLDTIGWDLVAMCADDVVCHGGRPWLFLDYLAMGRVEAEAVASVVGGIARACEACGCALVGGETAEHPGVMAPDAFDVAGVCLGLAERDALIDGSRARPGDVIIGLASSGLHANGFSLVRAVIRDHGSDLSAPFSELASRSVPSADGHPPEGEPSLGEVLLTPTRLYAAHLLAEFDSADRRWAGVTGVAHITGGGLPGNLPRAVGPSLGVVVDPSRWPVPTIIQLVAELASLQDTEMRATFNGGIGMAIVATPAEAERVAAWAEGCGLGGWVIGRVVDASDVGPSRYAEVA